MNSLYNQLNTAPYQQLTNAQPSSRVGGFTNIDQIRTLMNSVRNAQNPRMMMEQMIQSNPQFQSVMNLVRQNGGDPKTAFYNLARQRGVNPDEILSLLKF